MKLNVKFSRSSFRPKVMAGSCLFFWLSLLLLVTPSEFSDVVGHEPVQVTAGDDVILPCHLKPPFDVTNLAVEWKWNRHTVHLYRHMADNYDDQDEQFRDRTSMFHSEMVKGNISLKLTNVNKDDSGLYICYVPRLNSQVNRGNVLLRVNPQKDPEGGDNETQDDNELTRDGNRGVIVGSVFLALFLITAGFAGIFFFMDKKTGRI